MKRSEINRAVTEAAEVFAAGGWTLPPQPRWDVTDFGMGDFPQYGLVLINLAEEPEYCEKLMYAGIGQQTPAHLHGVKKEDIICRQGLLCVQVWQGLPGQSDAPAEVKINGQLQQLPAGTLVRLNAGERITLSPGTGHAFWPESDSCIIGEVSTANDDLNDNFFADPRVGRFSAIEEDEPPLVKLVQEEGISNPG
jgi:D-lyxose ketol-isomerase